MKLSILLFLTGLGFFCFQLTNQNQDREARPSQSKYDMIALDKARFLHELLQFEAALPLEQNDEALFDHPKLAVQTLSGYFIANDDGSELYRYHLNGSLDKVVARKGEGPGELGSLQFGTRIYGDQVGFWDIYKNQIVVFSESGDYQFSLSFLNPALTKGSWHPSGVAFDWSKPEQLTFGNILVRDDPEIRSGIAEVYRDERGQVTFLKLVATFGKRDLAHEAKFMPSSVYNFALIGETFWLGSPEFSTLHCYNLSTNKLDVIPVSVPEPLTTIEYEGVDPSDRKKLHWLTNYNGFIHKIIPHPEMVFVKVGVRGYVPFSPDGKQLLKKRLMSGLSGYQDTYNGTILFTASKRNFSQIESRTGVALIDQKRDMVYDEDHPYVVLARLKLEPKAVRKVAK